MKRKAFSNIAASSMIVAVTMVGCSGAAVNTRAGASAAALQRDAADSAAKVEKALAERDGAKAVLLAEAAVAGARDNAAYRTLLGRAYLASGRFASAQTAFQDALALGSKDTRTIVSLALVQTAQGQASAARDLLTSHMDVLPAADYGLAMALAGDSNEAIRVLGQAIHDPAAGAKERQNLAYSYALAGRWNEARLMASQDLAPLDAAQRVANWAQLAQPGAESARVLAMIGVQPVAVDGGIPAQLALVAPVSAQPVEVAAAEPAPAPVAEAAPAPAPLPAIAMVQPIPDAAPMIRAPQAPMRQPVAQRSAETLSRAFARPAAYFGPVNASQGSTWVVQLGAFDTPAVAQDSWQRMARHSRTVAQFPVVTSSITVRGRVFHRLAVAGFANRQGAKQLCSTVRAQGYSCFVRMGGAEAVPAKWAYAKGAKPQQIAMR
ncbi:SPOR domain-containing protein [Sphingobium subterraneum]|uniref:Flp pilus assembly protein TadD n=1 Tax=Sphingobium subterraneum TaxID=627688 RepID=A0A841IYT0_9SPHN|nr:SPOR domain-containing protein [Sphingobium subterraneum]MBB6123480.1 Flp pilus assembly protein TadD [Sphingobium subterraneum]